MSEHTLDEMIAEVRRELAVRRRVYPQLQAKAGRNKRAELDRRYDAMAAVLENLEKQQDNQPELPMRVSGGIA